MKITTNSQPTIHFQSSVTKNKGQVQQENTTCVNDNDQSHDHEESKWNSSIITNSGAHTVKKIKSNVNVNSIKYKSKKNNIATTKNK